MRSSSSDPPPLPKPGELFGLFTSLALTFLMMTGSAPVVNAGITRMAEEAREDLELSAFALAFVIAVFLHSPVFAVRDLGVRVIEGRGSLRRLARICFVIAAVATGLEIAAATTPLGTFLFVEVLGTSPEMAERAAPALLFFAPLGPLMTWRGLYQAIHIKSGRSRLLGYGTLLRLVGIAGIALFLAPTLNLGGAALGGLAFTGGVLIEAVLSAFWARGSELGSRDDPATALASKEIFRIAYPLWMANYLQVLSMPLIFRLVNETRDPADQVSALEVIKSVVWCLASTAVAVQTVTINWGYTREHLKAILRFSVLIVALMTAILSLLMWKPVQDFVLITLMQVDREGIRQAVAAHLLIALSLPVILATRSYLRGIVIRSGRTLWVTLGAGIPLAVPLLSIAFGWHLGAEHGTGLGVSLWVGVVLLDAIVLGLALVGSGVWRTFPRLETSPTDVPVDAR